MRRITFLFSVLILIFEMAGCGKQSSQNSGKPQIYISSAQNSITDKPPQTSTIPSSDDLTSGGAVKSDRDIINIAYQYLGVSERSTIIDWKNAEVERDVNSEGGLVGGPNGIVDLRGKNIYRVTFRTNNEASAGPICVAMDMNTYKIIGVGLRD
jgi:hypothetical protein